MSIRTCWGSPTLSRLLWKVYSVAFLAIRPHLFFAKLAGLDWYRDMSEMARVTASNGVVSCLFPTRRMDADSARRLVRERALTGFSAAAVLLWAARARKMDANDAIPLFVSAQLTDIVSIDLLDGVVCAISGRKSPRT